MYNTYHWTPVLLNPKHYVTVKNNRIYIPFSVCGQLSHYTDFYSFSLYAADSDALVKIEFHDLAGTGREDVKLSDSTRICLCEKKGITITSKEICERFFSGIPSGTPVRVPVEFEDASLFFKPILAETLNSHETRDEPQDPDIPAFFN